MVALFAATMGLSAFLLFWIQPMFAKQALPLLGGAPAVWNTALVFYQAVLLLGYLYAHISFRRLGARRQSLLHIGVILVPMISLPIGLAQGWTPDVSAFAGFWLIGLMAISIGLPFFAVAATAPTLQAWFGRSNHPDAADPYFLFAASNLASFAALIGYPFVIEPNLTLKTQSWLWSGGYLLLIVAIAACALSIRRHPGRVRLQVGMDPPQHLWRQRMQWAALAFVPSALLLAVTQHITTDIAALPLFWVMPLALYLLTYALAFARRQPIPHVVATWLAPLALIGLAVLFHWQLPVFTHAIPLHIGCFFVVALFCHGEMAKRRPDLSRLTEFYLVMSAGGVLGGLFTALIAPLVFERILEYPLLLVAAALLHPSFRGRLVTTVIVALALGLNAWLANLDDGVLYRDRSYFASYTVRLDPEEEFVLLEHGVTLHGAQSRDPAKAREPTTYFHLDSPFGRVMRGNSGTDWPQRVGIAGLGVGTMACYREPGQTWRYFEIDPLAIAIAKDDRYFSYLSRCFEDGTIVVGDARLSLEKEPDRHYDLLVLDAFTSDAVPSHLLTVEAIRLYLRKLTPGGLIMFNISNWNIDLKPVLAAAAAELGLAAVAHDPHTPASVAFYEFPSAWVALAAKPDDLALLGPLGDWYDLRAKPGDRAWTDDYSSLANAVIWSSRPLRPAWDRK